MFVAYLGLYTFVLAIIWGFFVVAKIHSYKFKNFSNHIEKVTIALFLLLLSLSILGYVLIFFLNDSGTSYRVDTSSSSVSETYY